MVFYDFIEIGTSDFDTEIEKEDNKIGISIEPVTFYLDRLKNKKDCIKMNIGISNYSGKCKVYYVPEHNINKYNFPSWVRGCNSINVYHKTVSNLCKDRNINIEEITESYEIDVQTLYQTMKQLAIEGVYYLKIDTEGHDTIILKKFYEDLLDNAYLPHVILFESNVLSNDKDVEEIIQLFIGKGYDLIEKENDTKLQLNLTNLKNKVRFSNSIKNYYIASEYPPNYDVTNLPHENTLESAKNYCIKYKCSGVTLNNGVYEVRNGKNIYYNNKGAFVSWIFL
uniref:Methyltransferase FkbM domain-containing protein n=1 Tax=viral metagenome TaxID=1070528 RepID=A0A6C0DQR6_9ZZZZ